MPARLGLLLPSVAAALAVGVVVVAGLLLVPRAFAHQDPCHSRHACPSDHHTYVWHDATGQGWSCARPGSDKLSGREDTTLVHDGLTYHCYAAGSSSQSPSGRPGAPAPTVAALARVIDGDTIALHGGTRVRLLQIDAPEKGACYAQESTRALRALLRPGQRVRLVVDPKLDAVDRFGRELRYVFRGSRNVNVQLVRRGAATVYFYRGERGRYAQQLLKAARNARANKRGLWGACRTSWDPNRPAATRPR